MLQGACEELMELYKMRLTASNFGKINMQIQSHLTQFCPTFFPLDLSKVAAIAHGSLKEKLARSIFGSRTQGKIKIFCVCSVFDAGIAVNPAYPYFGARPDGKVFNPSINPQYCLVEFKCHLSNVT